MPSRTHELPIELVQNLPDMATTLLECAFPDVDIPAYSKALLDCTDLAHVDPTPRAADAVTVLRDDRDKPVLGIITEVQLEWTEEKLLSWPVYQANLRARLRCPVEIVVLCPKRSVARRFAEPIRTDVTTSLVCPKILGSDRVPVVTDPQWATEAPELSVLSAITHGDDPEVLHAFAAALECLDTDRGSFYHDYVMSVLSEAARKNWEALMATGTYEWKSDFARKHRAEGEAEGEAKGEAKAILTVLDARGIVVSDAGRQRIQECSDVEQLNVWVRRAATVSTADELFA